MGAEVEILRGNITTLQVDAIVNAANTTLLGGGGVDGAIHRAAGPELLAECRTLGGCRPGEAKITRGYRLPARFVIHTVGPIWRGGKHDEAATLANCYRNSLRLAAENEIKTIAFPAISCGAYRYPIQEAAHFALQTTREFLTMSNEIQKVIFVLSGEDVYDTYRRLL
jgi:O-acetyl-ADP-ribose deacetylase (regulator of RNase III)